MGEDMIKAVMFDTKPYDRASFDAIPHEEIDITYYDVKLDVSTAPLAKGFDAVIVFVNDELPEAVIDVLYKAGVKLIALRCAGFNNVDVRAAYGKIHIVRVPAYSPEAVAEHTAALLLTSVRRIHKAYNRTRDFNFSIAGLVGINLHDKTAGVIGTGKIGRAFINICHGFGMSVIAYDKYPSKDVPATYVSLDELFERSDVVSLHCPLTDENEHMIDAAAIEKMKNGVIILNTSRGALVDAEALKDGIISKKIGAACLDVYEEETDLFFEDRSGHILHDDTLARLLSMPNVIITSHQAFLTEEALQNIAQTTLSNIDDFFAGRHLENEICYRCNDLSECRRKRKTSCF